MKSSFYRISLVILTLVITVVLGFGGTALATKAAPGKAVLEKSHGNDYVVLAAAKTQHAPKKK